MERDFVKIQDIHKEIINKLDELSETQTQNRTQYKEYVEKNKTNKVFGLDSFHYQSRLFDLELRQLNEQYSFINNRMYCDYYKLYGMVKVFYKESFKMEPKKRNYSVYKDLEQFKQFEFSDNLNLNTDIMDMIKKSFESISKNEQEVLEDKRKTNSRINLDNYILNHNFNNAILKNKVELYEKYLHSYHIYHMSYLSHLLDRLVLLFRQSTNPVKIGEVDNWVDVPNVRTDSNEEREPKGEPPPLDSAHEPKEEQKEEPKVNPLQNPDLVHEFKEETHELKQLHEIVNVPKKSKGKKLKK